MEKRRNVRNGSYPCSHQIFSTGLSMFYMKISTGCLMENKAREVFDTDSAKVNKSTQTE